MAKENKELKKSELLFKIVSDDQKLNNLIIRTSGLTKKQVYEVVNEKMFVLEQEPFESFVVSKHFCKESELEVGEKISLNYMCNFEVRLLKVNHLPSDLEKWVPYKDFFRYKMFYNIRCKDGTEAYGLYPNADSFTVLLYDERNKFLKKKEFKDTEIAEIQLVSSKVDDCGIPANSKYAIESNFDVFGKWILEEQR